MRKLTLAAAYAALALICTPSAATADHGASENPTRGSLYSIERNGERGRDGLRTHHVFEPSQRMWADGGWCQRITETELSDARSRRRNDTDEHHRAENAARQLQVCAGQLYSSVTERLDGRGHFAFGAGLSAVGAVISGGSTIDVWIGLGSLPIFYEELHGSRMTTIEYYAGFGVSWIVDQYRVLNTRFDAVQDQVEALEEALDAARQAEIALAGVVSRDSRGNAQSTPHNAELQRIIAELQLEQRNARSVLRSASDALRLRDQLDDWISGRFELVRGIAIRQQDRERAGPTDTFRAIVSAPFGAIADTLRGTSGAEYTALVTAVTIQASLEALPSPLGVVANTDAVSDGFAADLTKLSASSRSDIQQRTFVMQSLVRETIRMRTALSQLAAADANAPAPRVPLAVSATP